MMHNHSHFFSFFKNRELNELYLSISIKSFAMGLIGVFIPIYLYQLGYPLSSIFLFYAICSLVHAITSIPSAKVSARFGIKHSMLFSIPFLIVFLLLLYSIEQFNWPLPFLAIILGLYSSLFWLGYHVDFSKFSNKKKRGSQIGFIQIVNSFFNAVGPLIAGLILTFFGFKLLFIIVIFLLASSTIPLFFSQDVYEPIAFSMKGFFRKRQFKNIVAFFGSGIETGLNMTVWPLFIFIFILNEEYLSLGFVSSLTFISSMAFVFLVGKFANTHDKTVLKFGAITSALMWVVKSFIVTPIQVFVADIFHSFSKSSMVISFNSICYDRANRVGILKFITLREMVHHIGRSLFFILLMFISDFASVFRFGGSLSSLARFFF